MCAYLLKYKIIMTYTNKSIHMAFVSIFAVFAISAILLPSSASAAAPTCTFNVNDAYIDSGGSSTLTWDTSNANSVYINNGVGYVDTDGSLTLYGFYTDVTYVLTAKNSDGTTECNTSVHIDDDDYNYLAPTCDIIASPQSVSFNGSTILTWDSRNGAIYASIDNSIGAVQKQGSMVVENITETTTFKLSVSNKQGSNTCNVTVYRDTMPKGPAPTCRINIDPDTLSYGERAVISWNAYHSTSAEIDNGIGTVSLSGNLDIVPSSGATYMMTVQNQYGRVGYCSKSFTVAGGGVSGIGGNYYSAGTSHLPVNAYQFSNVVSLGSLPYTGVNKTLYIAIMLLTAIGSITLLYKLGREVIA